MNAFRLNRKLHRDLGYLFSVLTIVYAISGVAVNHTEDWNPTYDIRDETVAIGAFAASDLGAAQDLIVERLDLDPDQVRGRHYASPTEFKVFLDEGGEVSVDPATGQGVMRLVKRRPVLFEVNALHLNRLKGVWTWVADIYAIVLLYLAVGGLFMLKGKTGFMGRGKWFFGAGLVLPVVFFLWLT